MHNSKYYTRRDIIKIAAGTGLAGLTDIPDGFAGTKDNPIVQENKNLGTTDWQLTYIKSANYRSGSVEGYCSKTSLRPGESADIFISTEIITDVVIDFYRMGYYGGKGGRFMKRLGPFQASRQADPPIADHRLRACNWERTTSFTVPKDWLPKLYYTCYT